MPSKDTKRRATIVDLCISRARKCLKRKIYSSLKYFTTSDGGFSVDVRRYTEGRRNRLVVSHNLLCSSDFFVFTWISLFHLNVSFYLSPLPVMHCFIFFFSKYILFILCFFVCCFHLSIVIKSVLRFIRLHPSPSFYSSIRSFWRMSEEQFPTDRGLDTRPTRIRGSARVRSEWLVRSPPPTQTRRVCGR